MFGRAQQPLRGSVRHVADFWTWWSHEGRDEAVAMIDGGDPARFVAAITARTEAIDDRLSWHTEAGTTRPHRLVLSAAGAIEARATAERWRRAAPPDDAWEFASSRPGDVPPSGGVLSFAGIDLPTDGLRFRTATRGQVLDVSVHLPGVTLDEAAAHGAEIAMLLLDLVLGEDDVERYIGHIQPLDGSGAAGLTAAELTEQVRVLKGRSDWMIVEATYQDRSVAVLQVSPHLHPLDHLPFDRHTRVEMRYRSRADGLADREELVRVQEEQAALVQLLGGLATVVVTEMHAGLRTVHCYSDSADQNAADLLDRFARGRRGVRARHAYDPGWHGVRQYRAIGAT